MYIQSILTADLIDDQTEEIIRRAKEEAGESYRKRTYLDEEDEDSFQFNFDMEFSYNDACRLLGKVNEVKIEDVNEEITKQLEGGGDHDHQKKNKKMKRMVDQNQARKKEFIQTMKEMEKEIDLEKEEEIMKQEMEELKHS